MNAELDVVQFTAGELLKKVLDLSPAVAVFDCDGTLWGGDAGLGFMSWSLEHGLVSRSSSDWIVGRPSRPVAPVMRYFVMIGFSSDWV